MGWNAYAMLSLLLLTHSWKEYLLVGGMVLMSIGTGITTLLLFSQQKRLAFYTQSLALISSSVLTLYLFITLFPPILVRNSDLSIVIPILGGALFLTLLLAWFAWLLKRMDGSE